MNSERARIVAIALLTIGICLFSGSIDTAQAHHGGEQLALAADAEIGRTYVLVVEGMSCPTGCAPKVEAALLSIDGVESVDVDFEKKQARVRTAPGHTITQQACDSALGNSGYFVDGIEEIKADDSGT